jgi:hypothetical protein
MSEAAKRTANALRWQIFKIVTGPTEYPGDEIEQTILSYVAAALRGEREACAAIVESAPMGKPEGAHHIFAELCLLADAIRNRKE